MLDVTILKNVLMVAVASSIISTALIQRIKESALTKSYLPIYSFIISMAVGICFSLTFSDLSPIDSVWVGLISYVGADAIYKLFEDKIFSSLNSIDDVITIERNDKK